MSTGQTGVGEHADPALEDAPSAQVAQAEQTDRSVVTLRAALAVVVGLAGMLLVFGALDRIWAWSAEYGRAWVFLGYFLVLSVLGRLFWWGVDTLIKVARGAV